MGFKEKKFINYIREDRLNRVQAYVEKYGSTITKTPLDNRGRTAVHLSCHHASIYCFAYFLKHKPNLMKTDNDGNLPLHWALMASEKGERYAYTDIVLPLLKLCPASKDMPNKSGVTAKKMLADMGLDTEEINQSCESQDSFQEDSDEDMDRCYSEEGENEWREKLQNEMQDEYDYMYGRYDTDYNGDWENEQPESYDSWANRMSAEYSSKKFKSHNIPNSKPTKNSHQEDLNKPALGWTQEDQERFERQSQHEENLRLRQLQEQQDGKYSLLKLKLQFMIKYSKLFDGQNHGVVRLKDLPWVDVAISPEELLAVLLADVNPSDFGAKKRCLREQQVQWHPDKFLQKCGNRLAENEKTLIINAVNTFSQTINAALDNLSS